MRSRRSLLSLNDYFGQPIALVRYIRVRIKRLLTAVQKIGWRGAYELALVERATFQNRCPVGEWCVHITGWQSPIRGRYGSSDLDVFRQIFIEEEHSWIRSVGFKRRDPLILDCGANVGYASIFFLRLFPEACVIAVEPDDANFHVLATNLADAGNRIRLIKAGLWSHKTTLEIDTRQFRDGKEWSRQVQETVGGDAQGLQAITVSQLMALSARSRIDLLKIDIEGAEAVVFAGGGAGWLEHTEAIAIELHDDTIFGAATPIFEKAVSADEFDLSRSGELTIAVRRQRVQQ